ncbi:MAG: tRNA(Ile2) 2-agmatinylcytidine synthetase, partial [Methanosarcinales archaeon]|nr:tRNA(Ile2) 2-agmatinylcytidine synthetase [Methanosarcinales archaeon]
MIVAIDDTDSRAGGCTTYIASLVVQRFRESVVGYPLLVRLNPTIPHKTRGNGAVAIRFKADLPDDACSEIRDFVIDSVSRLSYTDDENTNPGVIFLDEKEGYGDVLAKFAMRAVQDVIEIHEAKAVIEACGIDSFHLKNGRGLIGALAASAFCLYGMSDTTY